MPKRQGETSMNYANNTDEKLPFQKFRFIHFRSRNVKHFKNLIVTSIIFSLKKIKNNPKLYEESLNLELICPVVIIARHPCRQNEQPILDCLPSRRTGLCPW